MTDNFFSAHHHLPPHLASHQNALSASGPPSSTASQTRSHAHKAVFARLTQPFIGSRPGSSHGLHTNGSGAGSGGVPSGSVPTSAPTSTPNRSSPRTVRYDIKIGIAAQAPSEDMERVVVAGRDMIRILRVGYNDVAEIANLCPQPGKQKATQSDVKWGTIQAKNTIAAAGTNGSLFLYDVKEACFDRALKEHTRQVHKLCFNPFDGRLLLSASQDGTIKLWDLRERKSRHTFHGLADAVRDVQFNAGNAVEFVAAFDSGAIQRWDYRNTAKCERKINAHSGPVFSIDWHPDGKHCVSGGRDRALKIWDFYADPRRRPKHAVSTIAPVSRVTWRPSKSGQSTELATCAISNEHRVYVWDLKRPHVPSRVWDEHTNVVSGINWRDEDTLWSCSKDGSFVQNDLSYAGFPIDFLSHNAFDWGPMDDFTFSVQRRGRKHQKGPTPKGFEAEEELSLREDRRRHGRTSSFRSPKPSLGSSTFLDSDLQKFAPDQTAAHVYMDVLFDKEAFTYFAENYVFDINGILGGESYAVTKACDTNARVAWKAQKFRTAQSWKMLKLAIKSQDEALKGISESVDSPLNSDPLPSAYQRFQADHFVARRALGHDYSSPRASGGTTPLAAPIDIDSPHSAMTPTQDKTGGIDERLLLPPSAFATSLGSSTASTDGDRSDTERRHGGLSDSDLSSRASPNGSAEQPPHPNLSAQMQLPSVQTSPDKERHSVDENTTLPLFTSSAEQTEPLALSPPTGHRRADSSPPKVHGRSPMPPRRDSDNSIAITDSSQTTSFFVGSHQPGLSINSERTSSSYGGVFGSQDSDILAGSSPTRLRSDLPPIREDLENSTQLGARTATLPEIHTPSFNSPAETEAYISEIEARPWGVQRMVEQLLEWYSEKGDAQTCAILVLLLSHTISFDPRRATEWIEAYIDALRRQRMYCAAAEVVKVASAFEEFEALKEAAMWNVHVDAACPECNTSLYGGAAGGMMVVDGLSVGGGPGGWCGKCSALRSLCALCETGVKGQWTFCLKCEHGGHFKCMKSWFVGEKMVECVKTGCGCICAK